MTAALLSALSTTIPIFTMHWPTYFENEGFIVRHYESAESFLINDRPEDPGCAILDVRMGKCPALFCMTG